jgi:YfiH family protein
VQRFIEPDWPAPANIVALTTTRLGGSSAGPYASFNQGDHVADDPEVVAANRCELARALPDIHSIQWLQQTHSTRVVVAGAEGGCPPADGSWSEQVGLACAVLTADCLPLLLCRDDGAAVAAVHAGWRGLAAGIVANAVEQLPGLADRYLAWLGPAIGASAFEVGGEVRAQFLDSLGHAAEACFVPSTRRGHYLADLYALARLQLAELGIRAVYGGQYCTYSDARHFYSYRRDGETGRMATLIGIKADQSLT